MKLSALTPAELRSRLQGPGLGLRTGAFTLRLHSAIPRLADALALLYGEHSLADPHGYADFHVELARPRGLRRWLRPQVEFRFDGKLPFKPLPLEQAFPMLEWGLNWCVSSHAHSYLMIHAAVVARDGHAAILPAPPGSGKSTLCAALVNRGWRLLSDELALLRLADGMLAPLPRPVSLKNASIPLIQAYAPQAVFSPSVRDTTKGTVAHMKPPSDSVARAGEAAHPAWLIFPRYEAGAPAELAPLPRARAFMRAADNAFNFSLLGTAGFQALGDLIDKVQCHEFRYSELDQALQVFAALQPPAVPR